MAVELISKTENPEGICAAAAWLCTHKNIKHPSDFRIDQKSKILKAVMSSGHLSILENAVFSFHIDGISRAASHQLVRHRLASYAQQCGLMEVLECH